MKKLLLVTILLSGCNMTPVDIYSEPMEFDWMPNDVLFQHNIRECRAQLHCHAADYFKRV